jgi:hypothetical protein
VITQLQGNLNHLPAATQPEPGRPTSFFTIAIKFLSLFPSAGKVTNLPAGRQEEPPLLIKG